MREWINEWIMEIHWRVLGRATNIIKLVLSHWLWQRVGGCIIIKGKVKQREQRADVERPIHQAGLLSTEMQRIHDMNNSQQRATGEVAEVKSRAKTPGTDYANFLWKIRWESTTKTGKVERTTVREIRRLEDWLAFTVKKRLRGTERSEIWTGMPPSWWIT